jgi:ditrans,polycis-polyprenyl diphosphate synthase
MDGNRRWAERRNLQRHAGHEFGFLQLKECLKWCLDLGVRVVTVYAFSIENFKRPSTEVDTLMKLAAERLLELVEEKGFLQRNSIRVQVLGDLELLPPHVQRAAAEAMRITRHHDRAVLNICMAYTAREEMLTAVRDIVGGVRDGALLAADITEELLSAALYTAPHSQAPPPGRRRRRRAAHSSLTAAAGGRRAGGPAGAYVG